MSGMQFALIVLAVITVAASAIHNNDTFSRDAVNPTPNQAHIVMVETSDDGEASVKVSVKSATNEAVSTETPDSTPAPANSGGLQYPGANEVSVSGNTTVYESADNPKVITDWYKERIRQGGYNIKNFVQTTVNGQTENKLVGSSGDKNISIEITWSGDGATSISISN
jgi:hypothetical protein